MKDEDLREFYAKQRCLAMVSFVFLYLSFIAAGAISYSIIVKPVLEADQTYVKAKFYSQIEENSHPLNLDSHKVELIATLRQFPEIETSGIELGEDKQSSEDWLSQSSNYYKEFKTIIDSMSNMASVQFLKYEGIDWEVVTPTGQQ